MGKIQIKKASIVNLATDAIVNAANENLYPGAGVCGAIFRAAGTNELQAACQAIGHCKTGSAVITPGFRSKSKYIIHAVGPRWVDGKHNEPQLLYGAYQHALALAVQNGCKSIGFPLISAGIYGYPAEKAWRKALQACLDFQKAHPDSDISIQFAIIDDSLLAIGKKVLSELDKQSTSLFLKELDADGLMNIKNRFSNESHLLFDSEAHPRSGGLLKILCEPSVISNLSVEQMMRLVNVLFPAYVQAEEWLIRYCDILLRVIDDVKKHTPCPRAERYETHFRTTLVPLLKKSAHTGDVLDDIGILEDVYKTSACLYKYYILREKEFSFHTDRNSMEQLNITIRKIKNIGNQVLGFSLDPVKPEESQYASFLGWILEELLARQEEPQQEDKSWI